MSLVTTHPFDDDHLQEECAVFGIFGTNEASINTALGLHALQHRGQEAAGIVSFDGKTFFAHRGLGHVGENFGAGSSHIANLVGHVAIGHNRYSTSGNSNALLEIQPFSSELAFGGFALAHNGNLTNAARLRSSLVETGSLFQSSSDTEIIVHLVARSHQDTVTDRLIDALKQIEGAYSLVCVAKDMLIGVRDPLGVRPLVLGKQGGAYVLASESCALDIVGAEIVRDLDPGEMVLITKAGIKSIKPFPAKQSRFCVFEYIYFARPDSTVDGLSVYECRKAFGVQLAIESSVNADVVVPVPDSGVPAAIGYAREASIPFELGIIRNHYVGRTFIEPSDTIRHLGVKLKHNANRILVNGKRVILIDDSIVRGTTSTKIVQMMRDAGAVEVHMRVGAPPITYPDFYGIDTPEQKQLLAANHSIDEMCAYIGADSLAFLSVDGLYKAMGHAKGRDPNNPAYTDHCFTGDYPTQLQDQKNDEKIQQLSLLSERR